jgi:hypothetical protein
MAKQTDQHDDQVVAPGGRRLKGDVHLVQAGATPGAIGQAGAEMPAPRSSMPPRGATRPVLGEGMVIAPGGARHREHVHLLKAGGTLASRRHSQVAVRRYPKPGVPSAANWITYGYWTNSSGQTITSLVTTWTVPPAPATVGSQLIYLFNGIEPQDGSTIVQPVLQWGDSGADEDGVNRTGQFWTVASWIVPAPDGHAYHTPHVPVNPGDNLVGAVTLLDKSAAGCNYQCEFQGVAGTSFTTGAIAELTWCMQTLEAYELGSTANPPYDLNAVTEYPDTPMTRFGAITIATAAGPGPAGVWQSENAVTNFGEQTVILTNASVGGEVDIYYSGAAPPAVIGS